MHKCFDHKDLPSRMFSKGSYLHRGWGICRNFPGLLSCSWSHRFWCTRHCEVLSRPHSIKVALTSEHATGIKSCLHQRHTPSWDPKFNDSACHGSQDTLDLVQAVLKGRSSSELPWISCLAASSTARLLPLPSHPSPSVSAGWGSGC